jgi:hypothetical protein
MPLSKDFFEVRCANISSGGMAFYLDAPPHFDNLVVALGAAPNVAHFTACVVRVEETTLDGKAAYLVGCRFTGRVYL